MRIVISGSSGLIGTALRAHLQSAGHTVVPLVRRSPSAGEIEWDPGAGSLASDALDDVDAVVHLAGAGIGDHRWTDAYKRQILDSRVQSTELLARTIAAAARPPAVLLSGSAIGIYGACNDEQLDESSPPGTGFLADVCQQWEHAAAAAAAGGTRVVLLRTGIVLSPLGGALKKQLPLFRFGLGGRFGSGRQWQSWITLLDQVRAVEHLLTASIAGPVNLSAPNPVTNAQFAKTLGKVLHRPALLPIPKFGPKLLLGSELADALLFTGQRVLPTALVASGFSFEHAELGAGLRAVLHR